MHGCWQHHTTHLHVPQYRRQSEGCLAIAIGHIHHSLRGDEVPDNVQVPAECGTVQRGVLVLAAKLQGGARRDECVHYLRSFHA